MFTQPERQVCEQFKRFVDQANELPQFTGESLPVAAFRRFVEVSRVLLVEPMRSRIGQLHRQLAPLRQVLLPRQFDVLRVAGLSFSENAYTELIAWVLNPETHQAGALAAQKLWLEFLGIGDERNVITKPVTPVTQLLTEDGIPDLVLQYPDFVVVVEAKTGTEEHPTPSSQQFQTQSYPLVVRQRLNLSVDHPTYIVFLTTDRSAAANPEAILTTYFEFALNVARMMAAVDLPRELVTLLATIVTHFATCAVPTALNTIMLLDEMDELVAPHCSSAAILSHLDALNSVSSILKEEPRE